MDETAKEETPLPVPVIPCSDVGRIIIVFPVRDAQKAMDIRQGIVALLADIKEAQIMFSIASVPLPLSK